MQNAEAKCLIFEWLYGVQMYLENDKGRVAIKRYSEDVERETFVLLLEWAMPLTQNLNTDIKEELSFWKNRHHDNAWNVFLAGRFTRDDFWDQILWEQHFNDMREQARVCRLQIIDLMEFQSDVNEEGDRLTPVIGVSMQDLEKSIPSERATIKCDDNPEAMARVEKYLQNIRLQQDDVDCRIESIAKVKKAIPPPTLHPTDPQMQALRIPENKAPSFASVLDDEKRTQNSANDDPVITIKRDKD